MRIFRFSEQIRAFCNQGLYMYNMRIVRFWRYLALSDIRNDRKATRAKETDSGTLSDAMLF